MVSLYSQAVGCSKYVESAVVLRMHKQRTDRSEYCTHHDTKKISIWITQKDTISIGVYEAGL